MRIYRRKLLIIVIVVVASGVWYFKYAGHHADLQTALVPKDFWGVTFSKKYAQELGIDWKSAYVAMIDDLGVRQVRLPVYWDDVEAVRSKYDFSAYDWMIAEGERRGVHFILNAGRRLPRWPECHQPRWTEGLDEGAMKNAHIAFTTAAIEHFKKVKSIDQWQLENEYFFPWFGECPKADADLLQKEIAMLRAHDQRPLILTDSGELNTWKKASAYSDVLGITIYRVVWNNYFGYFRWPWPAGLYTIKSHFAGKTPETTIVAELQAEPWPPHFRKVQDLTLAESRESFTVKQLLTNAEIARRTRFKKAYFWGVEWWYWLKTQGDSSIWDAARGIFQANTQ